jgi:hypothetical protein
MVVRVRENLDEWRKDFFVFLSRSLSGEDSGEGIGARWIGWGIVIGYCGLIFYFSSRRDIALPGAIPSADKIAHLLEYTILGWVWTRAMRWERPQWTDLAFVVSALIFASVYGTSDEWHQSYVPGRVTEVYDVVADAFGGTLGGICDVWWRRSQVAGKKAGVSLVGETRVRI